MSRRATRGPIARFARDPRVWLGLGVSALTLWLALRSISLSAVAHDLARANLPLAIGAAVPAFLVTVWLRALRWRHLTDAVRPMSRGALFRATAVGFMGNNVFPLRAGEILRAWYLGRETRTPVAPIFGTVILERTLDAATVVGLAVALLGIEGERAAGEGGLAVGVPLVLAAAIPVAGVAMLRLAPGRVVGITRWIASRVAPARVAQSAEDLVWRIAEGLGSLQGGRHLFWIALHTVLLWLVASVIPFLAGMAALGIHVGSPARTLAAAYVTLAAVGVAVAIPSAPGFFGPYHLAARVALSRFGVPSAQALAFGTLVHILFWTTTTLTGLVVLRLRATPLEELAEAAGEPGKAPLSERR